jgi:salicylate hydroxylase
MRVAVAGAGIAGLTAAIALSARGFRVDVYERAVGLEEIGAGIQLSPNAMAALDGLDVIPDLAGRLLEPKAIEVRDAPSGERLASIPLGETARIRHGRPYCVVHRADLQDALLGVAERRGNIALHLGAEVRAVGETNDGIAFRAGGADRRADVLVAADGVNSDLRPSHFGHPSARPTGHVAWRATLTEPDIPHAFRRDVTGLWLAAGAHLVHYPLRGGKCLNVVAIAAAPVSATPPPCFGAALLPLMKAVPSWTPWPLLELDPSPSWVRGRGVLIGDAAHAMLPTAAQGGAQAIEDAWVLAQCLAAGGSVGDALAAFERLRRPRVERVVRHARRNIAIYELKGFAAVARNTALKGLPASLLLSRLDWLFSWTPQ